MKLLIIIKNRYSVKWNWSDEQKQTNLNDNKCCAKAYVLIISVNEMLEGQ
jgi:hypothetical protein